MSTYSVVPGANHTTVAGNCDTSHADVVLGYQLVRALVLAQVPNPHVSSAITADQLALIRMNDHVVDGHSVRIVALHIATPGIPDLYGAVLARCNKPLRLAMKRYTRDVGCMSVEGKDRIRIGGLDIVKLDCMVARGGEVAFIGRYTQAVHL